MVFHSSAFNARQMPCDLRALGAHAFVNAPLTVFASFRSLADAVPDRMPLVAVGRQKGRSSNADRDEQSSDES